MDAGGAAPPGHAIPARVDSDDDGTTDVFDNCPRVPNPDQRDRDGDGLGDLCDPCPTIANPDGKDPDGDGHVDACDNCPSLENPEQYDADGDGLGDLCDGDRDGDGIANDTDPCPDIADDWGGGDADGDGVGDACDNCAGVPNPAQRDQDLDGIGDQCECTGSFDDGALLGGAIAQTVAVVFDPSTNHPHIVYRREDGGQVSLEHAFCDGGRWQAETVALTRPVGISAAVDAMGRLHVVHANYAAEPEVRYTRRGPSGWTTERVLDAGARHPQMALDADGRPHIVYGRVLDGERDSESVVRVMRFDGTGWRMSDLGYGRNPSIALGPDGRTHVVYENGPGLWHAYFDRRWVMSRLPGLGTDRPVVQVDPEGTVHVVSRGERHRTVYYGTKSAGAETWAVGLVAEVGILDLMMVLDPLSGAPYIFAAGADGSWAWRYDAEGRQRALRLSASISDISLALGAPDETERFVRYYWVARGRYQSMRLPRDF